jgi:tyrosine-protein kinase Etk/Wzc
MLSTNRSSRHSSEADFAGEEEDQGGFQASSQRKVNQLISDFVGRWYWIALGAVIGALCASYYLSKTPKQYTATASLLIKQQTQSVMNRDQVDEIDMRSQDAMNTVAERVRRLDLLERVGSRQDVRDLVGLIPPNSNWMPEWYRNKQQQPDSGPKEDVAVEVPPPSVLGEMIGGWLKVSIRKGTRLLDISVNHPVPEVAKAIADAVAREYLEEIVSTRTEGRTSSIDVLEKQSKEARTNLESARSALAIYNRAIEVHKALDEKESEFLLMQHRYLPKHPKMIAKVAELKQLQDQFLAEFDIARDALSDKSYWDVADKELPDRAQHPDEYLRVARQQLLGRIGTLDSEIDSSTLVFNSMLTRIQEASVNEESGESSAEVSNLARVPAFPTAPVPSVIMVAGSVGGLFCGLFVAFLFIRFDDKYHTVSQIIGDTGSNALAAIADIKNSHLQAAAVKYKKKHTHSTEKAGQETWERLLVFRDGLSSTSYAEMFRVLRASISLLGDETKRKVTLFTSAIPGEGKSSISANFALAAACQGRKTLLIDLDLRKPSIHKVFGISRDKGEGGITECLANQVPFKDVIIRESGQENLHLILSGKRAPNPGELLNTTRLAALLELACAEYDVVVLDTAPILAVPDTRVIAPLVDNVCLVVRADYTPKGAVRRVLETMEEDGTTISGLIFNGFKEKRRLMGENYSYGQYGRGKYGRAYRYGYGTYGEDDDES